MHQHWVVRHLYWQRLWKRHHSRLALLHWLARPRLNWVLRTLNYRKKELLQTNEQLPMRLIFGQVSCYFNSGNAILIFSQNFSFSINFETIWIDIIFFLKSFFIMQSSVKWHPKLNQNIWQDCNWLASSRWANLRADHKKRIDIHNQDKFQ